MIWGLFCGVLIGWIMALPEDKKEEKIFILNSKMPDKKTTFKEESDYTTNCSAYLDLDEWKECMKECPFYTVTGKKTKTKKRKKK